MKIGIMQPYFFPYIGYWQLINAVDKFVIYDNIKFTKKGWIKRNRILVDGKDKLITLPIKMDSDELYIKERQLADSYIKDKGKMLNQIKAAYIKSPQFDKVLPIIEECLEFNNKNLFEFLYNSIKVIANYLEIDTEIVISSDININHSLKNKYRIFEICKTLGGDFYINPIGGIELYEKGEFIQNGIELKFIKTDSIEYVQCGNKFIPNLSIIDVMMFNSKKELKELLKRYSYYED